MKKSGALTKYSPCQSAEIGFVRFGTFSKEEIQAWSVAEITEGRLYDGNQPTTGGPNDLRLGINSLDQICLTCGESRECQGHFGHIKLAEAIYHYGYLQFVEKVLRCICHNCSKLKMFTTDQQKDKFKKIICISNPQKKLKEMAKLLAPINQCPVMKDNDERSNGCGSMIPTKITTKNHRIIVQERIDKNKFKEYQFSAQRVKNIFAKINIQDSKLLGFVVSKPVDLLISTLAVAPPQIRPRIQMNPQKKAEDDITIAYLRIVCLNNELKCSHESAERNVKVIELQRLVASIMVVLDRQTINSMQSTAKRYKKHRKIKSIEERLKSKQGRFRQHLMGKRVDFSARSVISPDSNLALDELGVPEKIANSLTIPQKVTEWNFDRILKLCSAGKVKYILRPTADRRRYEDMITVAKLNNSVEQISKYLSYGTIIERNLQNGDYVLFNRQPTLHRMSMMAHRVKILPFNTFRLNLSVCTPYNADFDGDEMNMHVPQSFQTIAELKHIAHIPKQIIAPKNNAPVMGIVQDSLLGIYLLTMRDTFLTREEIMNLIIWIEPSRKIEPGQLPMPAILRPQPLWTGKQVVSLLIAAQISLHVEKGNDGYRNKHDTSMLIRHGQLLSGALQRQVVGSGSGGLIHALWLQIGPEATSEFITNAQRVVNNWLMTSSFSVGAADVVTDKQFEQLRRSQYLKVKERYYETINKYRIGNKIHTQNLHQRGKKILDSLEFKINMDLNNTLSNMQKIVAEKVSAHKNNIYKMITAKSKGSQTNLAQIMFCLGNQNVDGRRCPLGFSRRALPHFRKDDNSPQPRGFVFSSFFKGLKPHQFFFHSMGGRQGLSDTAVKTSNIGYIQRKLVKSLQDIMITYDGSVRDSQSNFMQKLYGQDGFLAEYIERHKGTDCLLSEQDFKNKYSWPNIKLFHITQDQKQKQKIYEQYDQLLKCRQRLRKIFIQNKQTIDIQYYCPIKITRLIGKILQAERDRMSKTHLLHPVKVIDAVQKLINQCVMPQYEKQYAKLYQQYFKQANRAQFHKKRREFEQATGVQIFHIHLRLNLASKLLCEQYKFDQHCLNILMAQIKSKFRYAIAPAGEAIGSVAAQSIGEPTTQMTLNTFHLAGVSDRNVTLGIPRLRELLDASKKIKTPYMSIYYLDRLLERERDNQKITRILAELITFELPQRHVKDYLMSTKIYYDPNPESSNIDAPIQVLVKNDRRSPWVISIKFDGKRIANIMTWKEITKKIEEKFQQNFEITQKYGTGGQQDPQMIMRCFEDTKQTLKNIRGDQNTIFKFLNGCESQLKEIFVSGIKGIKTVKTSKRIAIIPTNKEDISKIKKQHHEEIIFEAEGTNLKACLSHGSINCERTASNDINQVFELLGIEAARQTFLNQFNQILKPYSIYINHRHLSVLADWMTTRGFITPINRNGINRVRDVSILRKASFEETVDILFGAAAFSQVDQLKGVSQRIIFGQNIKLGTNSFELILDRSNVKNYKYKGEKDRVPLEDEENCENEDSDQNQLTKPQETPKGFQSQTFTTPLMIRTPMSYKGNTSPTFNSPIYTSSPRMSPGASSPLRSPLYYPPQSPTIVHDALLSRMSSMGSPMYTSPSYRLMNQQTSSNQLKSSNYNSMNSQFKSPNYNSSNSPIYSSLLAHPSQFYSHNISDSPSPQYSPIRQNSPSYTPVTSSADRNIVNKKQEDASESQED